MTRICELCEKRYAAHRHHVFNGIAQRKQSEKYKMVIYLCVECHNMIHDNQQEDIKLKRRFERKFIDKYGAKKYLQTFHTNYLDEEII